MPLSPDLSAKKSSATEWIDRDFARMTHLALTKDDSATIGFVVACLFAGAIDIQELRSWADPFLPRATLVLHTSLTSAHSTSRCFTSTGSSALFRIQD